MLLPTRRAAIGHIDLQMCFTEAKCERYNFIIFRKAGNCLMISIIGIFLGTLERTINTSYILDEGQLLINIFLNLEDKLEFVGCTTEILNSINFYLISILDIACKRGKVYYN